MGVWFVVQSCSCGHPSHSKMGWVIWLHSIKWPLMRACGFFLYLHACGVRRRTWDHHHSLWRSHTKKADTHPKHTLCRHSIPAHLTPLHTIHTAVSSNVDAVISFPRPFCSHNIVVNRKTAWLESAIRKLNLWFFTLPNFQATVHQCPLWSPCGNLRVCY